MLRIQSDQILVEDTESQNYIKCIKDGAVTLYHNSSERLATTSWGAQLTGRFVATGNIDLADSSSASDARITLGDGDEFQVYRSSNDSHINSSSGELRIEGDQVKLRRADGLEDFLVASVGSDVKLFFNGTERISTLGVGVTVNGSIYGGSATSPFVKLKTPNSHPVYFEGDANRSGNGNHIAVFRGLWNSEPVGAFVVESAHDTTNKDNGSLLLQTAQNATGGLETRVFIKSTGEVGINDTTPSYQLDVSGDVRAGNNSSQGLILVSPNGTHYRVTVDNSGNLSASSV